MIRTGNIDLKRIAGQMLILGFRGEGADSHSAIAREIGDNNIGGVIYFDKDMVHHQPVHNIKSPEQVATLSKELQSYSDTPLFISVDQEGGVVNRLKADYGFPETKSHLNLGNADSVEETFAHSKLIASSLKSVGINLNFAPVVDIDSNLANPIIHKKERSFSADTEKVIAHARAYVKGHQSEGVLSTLKHFPGHGSSFGDSHLGFTDVTETWKEEELAPYNKLISEEGFDEFVMSTHIYNAHLDKDHPATLSKKILTGMLKESIGFKGIVVSDDMQMRAITDKYGLDQAVVLAINAGVDMLCFGNNLAKEPITSAVFVEMLEKGLDSKQLTMNQLEAIYNRIIAFKNLKLNGVN